MAQKVRMPDGKVVAFPDDMPQEEIRALVEAKYPEARPEMRAASKASGKLKGKVDDLPSRQPPQKTLLTEAADYTSQAMSGVNEGLAMAAGAPVDLLTAGVNAGAAGINAVAGTDIKPIQDPVGGSKMFTDLMSPTIGEESAEPGKQVVRRIGQEVGAAALPGAAIAVKAAKPLAVAGNTLKTAIGSGAGAAVAEQIDPTNPWLEIAGQVVGGGASSLVRGGKKVPNAPAAEELQQMKRDAYKAVDGLGAAYTPQSYSSMTNAVDAAVKSKNISPTRHPKAFSFVEDMRTRFKNGMTLTELDQLRQEVRRDLMRSPDESERFFGDVIIDEIDDFIAKAGPGQMASGNGADAANAITTARELNTRWRKTEMIEDALYKAEFQTAATGSGGNINNKIKQALTSILTNEKKRRAFSADEIAELEGVIKSGKGEDLLRLVGKLSPSGNGLMAALGIGGTVANPLLAAVPVAGMVAKGLADGRTLKKAATLRANIAAGKGNTLRVPSPDRSAGIAAGALGGAIANDNIGGRNTLRANALQGVL